MKIIREKSHSQLISMPKLFPVNCYLVKEKGYLTLIDCSIKRASKKIIEAIQAEKMPLKYIILTHAHSDHVGDLEIIKNVFPNAKVILSEKEAREINKRSKDLVSIPVKIDQLVNEGDRIGSLLIKETPGHTIGSISMIDLRTKFAFVGDLIQTRGGNAIAGDKRFLFPFPAIATQDKLLAIQSFQKLSAESIVRYYCGHGFYLENKPEEIQRLIIRGKQNSYKNR